MPDSTPAEQDFLVLREQSGAALLATMSAKGEPCASYAPLVWVDNCCFLFLSDLADHTVNLRANPGLGLLLLQSEQATANAFARQRISLRGSAEIISRENPLFSTVLPEFHRRFGEVVSMIEPLGDFHLFRIRLQSGQFVRGFGQAYRLSGENLDELEHIRPA